MVLAPDDVGHAEVDIVDHARQQVKPAAVFPPHNRIRQQFGIEPLFAADQVVPSDRSVVFQPEPPMRSATFRDRSIGRLAFVDRRQPAAEQDLPAKVQFFRRLVAGVDTIGGLQPLELPFVEIEAVGLPERSVKGQAKPFEIVPDRLVEIESRALAVGVVDAQEEAPAMLLGEEEIMQRRPDIADMEPAGRRWRKAGNDCHPVAP
jgi:hypothetical protein